MGVFRGPFTSGFDNDIVVALFFPGSFVPADINAWMYLEYRSAARLAERLGHAEERAGFLEKAAALKRAANALLWHAQKESFAAYSLCEGRHIFGYEVPLVGGKLGEYAFQTVSNLVPLYTGLADEDKARAMIRRYVLSAEHFLSPFGIRTLSKASEFYNNARWGNPSRFSPPGQITASNWQGPVWIPICYFMFHALRRHGFAAEALDLAGRTLRVLAEGLDRIGCFTENYHGETGEPLYARDFAAWNILADVMIREAEENCWLMQPIFQAGPEIGS
jgi:putative isomerase